MITVKQELERAEERIELVEYRSAERASEIEEALDSYVTRVRQVYFTKPVKVLVMKNDNILRSNLNRNSL